MKKYFLLIIFLLLVQIKQALPKSSEVMIAFNQANYQINKNLVKDKKFNTILQSEFINLNEKKYLLKQIDKTTKAVDNLLKIIEKNKNFCKNLKKDGIIYDCQDYFENFSPFKRKFIFSKNDYNYLKDSYARKLFLPVYSIKIQNWLFSLKIKT